MKKGIFTVMLMMCILCACNSTKDVREETTTLLESADIEVPDDTNYFDYEVYNDVPNIETINLFSHITEADIHSYSEQVKGTYSSSFIKNGIFPVHLISMLAESLYNSNNIGIRNFMDDILSSSYFETIRTLGADNYQLSLDEVYQLFPEVQKHKLEKCIAIFHMGEVGTEEEIYVFVYNSGGTNGVKSVSVNKRSNEKFVDVCEFEIQNDGHGRVINYEESFYYIFLEYNYNLKNYDGIRIHKLGTNADTENVLIKYLPEKYIWKNIYKKQINPSSTINNYIETIRTLISSDQYIESGRGNAESAQLLWGDEKEDSSFPLADEYNHYYKIDCMNTGIPIHIRKSDHVPSYFRLQLYVECLVN